MVAPGQWFMNQRIKTLKLLSFYIHRSTLPQSRIRSTAPSKREPGESAPFPAPSLRELARPTGVTEGVSSDGCFGPTIYEPAHIGSEIFEILRSSGYTPSVSHSLDSSLREGAGNGLHHSSGYSLKSGGTGDFHRPYEGSKIFTFYCVTKKEEYIL